MSHKEEKNAELELDHTLIETTHKVETLYVTYKKQINMAVIAAVLVVAGYISFNKFYIENY